MIKRLGCTLSVLLVAALPSTSSAQNCTICGNAANNFINPTAEYDDLSCEKLQSALTGLGTKEACDNFLAPSSSWFQYESFCGCEGSVAPDSCKICGDGEILAFPFSKVPWTHVEARHTCADAVEIARHVTNSTVCSNFVATPAVKETCCRKIGEVCPVCRLPGTKFNRERRYENITCGMLEEQTKELNKNECSAYYSQDTHYWMNWKSFCGCEGVAKPKGCPLCGTNMEVVNPNATAPWEETEVYTCAQAEALTSHISDEKVCRNEVQTPATLKACCGPIAAVASAAFAPAAILSAATGLVIAASMMVTA